MGLFDAATITNLVGQLGGDHEQAGQILSGLLGQSCQVDTQQHGDVLQQLGVDPQHLEQGGYQDHLDNQNPPDFQNYDQGQEGSFGQGQQVCYDQSQQGGYDQDQSQGQRY